MPEISKPPAATRAELTALRRHLSREIPRKSERNLLIGTWNIREFGGLTEKWRSTASDTPKRDLHSLACITEIVSRFDVVAIQEAQANLRALRHMLQALGERWTVILTDPVEDDKGDNERLAFVFDRERLEVSGLACELVVPFNWKEKGVRPISLERQFARTPYAVAFKRLDATFILVTLHVFWGSKSSQHIAERARELASIATWLRGWTEDVTAGITTSSASATSTSTAGAASCGRRSPRPGSPFRRRSIAPGWWPASRSSTTTTRSPGLPPIRPASRHPSSTSTTPLTRGSSTGARRCSPTQDSPTCRSPTECPTTSRCGSSSSFRLEGSQEDARLGTRFLARSGTRGDENCYLARGSNASCGPAPPRVLRWGVNRPASRLGSAGQSLRKGAYDVDKPTGPRTLTLEAEAPVDERCDMAKRAYNSARRGKLAYQALVFGLAVVLAVAASYAVISFTDEQEARGFLGVVGAVGSLLVGGFFGALAKDAREDENAMWARVDKCCGGD